MARKQQKGKAARAAKAPIAKPRLLWVGDSGCYTGFAEVTRNVLTNLLPAWDCAALAINYFGDPHTEPFPLFPASLGGDVFGVNRLEQVIQKFKPDAVGVLNDPWIAKDYLPVLRKYPNLVRFLYTPIDSPHVAPGFAQALNEYDAVVSYTEFGAKELDGSGTNTRMFVVPHGIDPKKFYPMKDARKLLQIPEDWYIVGFVGRNQPRKRIDLAMRAFADFIRDKTPEEKAKIKFYYHGNVNDIGWNIVDMAVAFGIQDNLGLTSDSNMVVTQEVLNRIYNSFNVMLSTTMGEGWGLCNMEAAACGVPQIVPEWSALQEWLVMGAIQVPCPDIMVNTGGINTIGGIVKHEGVVDALNTLYRNPAMRVKLGIEGRELILNPMFDWRNIAGQFDSIIREVARDKLNTDQKASG